MSLVAPDISAQQSKTFDAHRDPGQAARSKRRKHQRREGTGVVEPFWSAAPSSAPATRRLLLLSYHFPPSRAVGGLRWQKLSRHFAEHGWGIDVVTLAPVSVEDGDASRLADLPTGTSVYGVSERRVAVQRVFVALLAARRRVKGALERLRARPESRGGSAGTRMPAAPSDSLSPQEIRSIPRSLNELVRYYTAWLDLRVMKLWARDAARVATALAKEGDYSAVITCGPPHMVHEAGRVVASATGLPLIVDMRDPWSLVQRLPEVIASPVWLRSARRFEKRAIDAASVVVVNTEPHQRALQRIYPGISAPIITVMNGYDDEPMPIASPARCFVIAYAGSIYLDRDPRPLFTAAGQVIKELGLTPDELKLSFMGSDSFAGVALKQMAEGEGIAPFLEVLPGGSRSEALEFLARASMVVSLPQDSDMAIPAKIFEYMQFRAWLLAFAEPHSATALLLEGSVADVVKPGDSARLTTVLRERYRQHARGESAPRLADEVRFSRRRQAEILLDALTRVASPKAPAQS